MDWKLQTDFANHIWKLLPWTVSKDCVKYSMDAYHRCILEGYIFPLCFGNLNLRDYHGYSLNAIFSRFPNCFLPFPLVFRYVSPGVSTVSFGVSPVSLQFFPFAIFDSVIKESWIPIPEEYICDLTKECLYINKINFQWSKWSKDALKKFWVILVWLGRPDAPVFKVLISDLLFFNDYLFVKNQGDESVPSGGIDDKKPLQSKWIRFRWSVKRIFVHWIGKKILLPYKLNKLQL